MNVPGIVHGRLVPNAVARAERRAVSSKGTPAGRGGAAAASRGEVLESRPPHRAAPPALASTPSHAAPSPIIANGRTDLGDGLFAIRAGDTVTVHFDTPSTRTRRRDKFERVLRATLPKVYGAPADSLLAAIPVGALVPVGVLPAELSDRGLRLPPRDGRQLIIWPETRPGRDGPLVVAYRTAPVR
jgi:hypothetical protein